MVKLEGYGMETETMKKMIGIADVAVVKEKAYISNRFYNSFIIYNIKKDTVEQVKRFVHMDAGSFAYHMGCVVHNGIVYFYPANGYGVHAYDIERGHQKYYDLGFCHVDYSHVLEDKMILFPWYSEQGLITIDLKKETIQTNLGWWDASSILGDAKSNSLHSGEYNKNQVWSHCTKTNYLLLSDCYSRKLEKHLIDVDGKILWGSQYDGKDFWFTEVDKAVIYQWNIEKGLRNKFKFELTAWEETGETSPYRKVVCVREHVFVVPYNENALFILNKETEKLEKLSEFPEEIVYPRTNDWYIFEKQEDNQLYLFCDLTNLIIHVDLDTLDVKYRNTFIKDSIVYDRYTEQIWKSIFEEIDNKGWISENEHDWKTYLPDFLKFDDEIGIHEKISCEENIGNKIYQEVMAE